MRRLVGALIVTTALTVVAASPAGAATRSVTAVVAVQSPAIVGWPPSGPAVSADAPSGTFTAAYGYIRVGRGATCDDYLGEWTYDDGMGNTVGGRMDGPSNCDIGGLPITVGPPLLVHHIDLQIFRSTGAFAGATGGGTLDAAYAGGALAGVLQLKLTTPG